MIHPVKLMLIVWLGAIVLFFIMPFQLTTRSLYLGGFIYLLIFLSSFCIGAMLKTHRHQKNNRKYISKLGFSRADLLLKIISLISIFVFTIEIFLSNSLNLVEAYIYKTSQQQAVLEGGLSNSSIWFKIGFLTYPASYIFLAKEIIFAKKIKIFSLAIYGVLPGLLSAFALGGRTTLFNVIAYSVISYFVRSKHLVKIKKNNQSLRAQKSANNFFYKFVFIALMTFSMAYFINIFFVRAEDIGGAIVMLDVVGDLWGVKFSGPLNDIAINILGPTIVFLIFAFSWYLLQGVVMTSDILWNYDGSMLLGVYGIDLFSAIVRRINPMWVSENFNYLISLDTYGFYPSAFGTLYIDFGIFGLLIALLWGWGAGLIYNRIKSNNDPRWRLWVPFIVFGIIFSLINTPLGYSNGLITHFWLLVIFLLIKRKQLLRIEY